jgi:predicted lipoprotein with Yx(FWY)xxD motif
MRPAFTRTALLATLLLVAACGGGSRATTGPTTGATTAASVAPSAAAGEATVMLASSDLGEILVDGTGRTLYGFLPDEAGEPTCYDTCAGNWPPLVADGEITVGEGLDDSSFSTVARTDDAGDQVKVGDWPLYYFANDTAPGQTNGQGVGGNWFVVGADGELIEE